MGCGARRARLGAPARPAADLWDSRGERSPAGSRGPRLAGTWLGPGRGA